MIKQFSKDLRIREWIVDQSSINCIADRNQGLKASKPSPQPLSP